MSETPVQQARRLLGEVERIESLSHWQRGAEKILLHQQLADSLSNLLAYHEGHAEKHLQLVTLVEGLLSALHASTLNGSAPWWDQAPRPHSRFVSAIKRLRAWLLDDG